LGYAETMKTVWQGRVTQAAAKYGEVSQTATVCCNACRTCVQTNLIAAALTTAGVAGAWITRRFHRSKTI